MDSTAFDGRRRVVIENVSPEIDGGRYAIKRAVGDPVQVSADIFTDGHDAIACRLLYRHESQPEWSAAELRLSGNDRFVGSFSVSQIGRYLYGIQAWVDHFISWRKDLTKRIAAETDQAVDYAIGAQLIAAAAERVPVDLGDGAYLRSLAQSLASDLPLARKRTQSLDEVLLHIMSRYPDLSLASTYERELPVTVDPERARFSAWYEFFPRSAGRNGIHGTFAESERMIEHAARLGFDVVYLPPIHPIGETFRKGRNNTATAAEGDIGSPWAIGGAAGGHKDVHPDLGTLADFDRLVKKASSLGIAIALDIAFQASPDHPYVREHDNWFRKRPDGTIQYAENPPKKYQDIYPFDFENENWHAMFTEFESVFEFWHAHGVSIFRVDNPHTKSFPFWEWVIARLKQKHPELIFLSEAFTRPKLMYRLAKVGFTQSYTYFPWRNLKEEIIDYMTEVTQSPVREYFRPNHWPNTPDILTEYLQTTGTAGFLQRFLLAATLGANYGIYGPSFELMDAHPVKAGSEEYLDSEKYQLREWNLNRADSLSELIALVNRVRRENPALQQDWTLRFHPVDNDQLLCYSKHSTDGANLVFCAVNLDPWHKQSGHVRLALDELGLSSSTPFQVHELLTNARYLWSGERAFIEIDSAAMPGQIFRVRKRVRTEREFEYFL